MTDEQLIKKGAYGSYGHHREGGRGTAAMGRCRRVPWKARCRGAEGGAAVVGVRHCRRLAGVEIAHLKILSPLAWTTRSYLKLRCGPDESSPAARLVANEGHDYYDLEFDEYIGFCQLYSPR
jgi:hypothetical protein